MQKKLKLNLKDLKIQSFVTSLENGDKTKIKAGGTGDTACEPCQTDPPVTCTCLTCITCITCNTCGCVTNNPKVYTCDPQCSDFC
jgi:hypothetical protein